jgi:hypothetical protein
VSSLDQVKEVPKSLRVRDNITNLVQMLNEFSEDICCALSSDITDLHRRIIFFCDLDMIHPAGHIRMETELLEHKWPPTGIVLGSEHSHNT